MALYTKVKMSDFSRTSSGKIRANAVKSYKIDTEKLEAKILKDVARRIKNGTILDVLEKKEPEKKPEKINMKTLAGGMMMATQAAHSVVSVATAASSTDEAATAIAAYRGATGAATLAIGTSSPLIGLTVGIILNLVSKFVTNQIQLSYDNSRLMYRYDNYDISRYSTYTYDYENSKWVAQDTQRVSNSILNGVNIS